MATKNVPNLKALGDMLTRSRSRSPSPSATQAKTPKRSSKAAAPSPQRPSKPDRIPTPPVALAADQEPPSTMVRLTESEDTQLGLLSRQLVSHGCRVGHRGVNNTNVLRYALRRWEHVTPEDARKFSVFCEESYPKKPVVNQVNVDFSPEEYKHLDAIANGLISRGIRRGHKGVNAASIMRFALMQWKEASREDARQLLQAREIWRAQS